MKDRDPRARGETRFWSAVLVVLAAAIAVVVVVAAGVFHWHLLR